MKKCQDTWSLPADHALRDFFIEFSLMNQEGERFLERLSRIDFLSRLTDTNRAHFDTLPKTINIWRDTPHGINLLKSDFKILI